MTDPNEPAFSGTPTKEFPFPKPGLTKREHTAIEILRGLMACPDVHGNPVQLAGDAVRTADALIAALNRTE